MKNNTVPILINHGESVIGTATFFNDAELVTQFKNGGRFRLEACVNFTNDTLVHIIIVPIPAGPKKELSND